MDKIIDKIAGVLIIFIGIIQLFGTTTPWLSLPTILLGTYKLIK